MTTYRERPYTIVGEVFYAESDEGSQPFDFTVFAESLDAAIEGAHQTMFNEMVKIGLTPETTEVAKISVFDNRDGGVLEEIPIACWENEDLVNARHWGD